MPDTPVNDLAPWIVGALREPVPSGDAQRAAIMTRVRQQASPRALQAPMRASRWSRRGIVTPIGGALMTALLLAVASLRSLDVSRHGGALDSALDISAVVLGDSVVPTTEPVTRDLASGDAVSSRLLDTLRIVEFVLRGASVRSASVIAASSSERTGHAAAADAGMAGDGLFGIESNERANASSVRQTTLAHEHDGVWRARMLVPRDALRMAYLINGSQLVPITTLRPTSSAHRSTADSI